jgi:WD40 repeat protein
MLENKKVYTYSVFFTLFFLLFHSVISFSQTKEIKKAHEDVLLSILYTHSGNELISTDAANLIRIWNTSTKKKDEEFFSQKSYNWKAVLNKKGDKIWICNTEIACIDWKTKKQVFSFGNSETSIYSISLSPKEDYIVSGHWDNAARIWDTQTQQCLQVLQIHSKPVLSVAFHPTQNAFLTASSDKTIAFWRIENAQVQLVKQWTAHDNDVSRVVFSPDGNYFLSASGDETIKLWNYETLDLEQVYKGHSAAVTAIAFSPDAQTFISGSLDAKIIWWQTKTGFRIKEFTDNEAVINCVAFSPKGNQIAAVDYNLVLRFWELTSADSIKSTENVKYSQLLHRNQINQLAISEQEDMLASVGKDSLLIVWGVKSVLPIHIVRAHEQNINCVAISPDSKTIATGSYDKTIKLWNAQTGLYQQTLSAHSDWLQSLDFSPSGKNLLSSSWDKSIILWDAKNGKLIKTLQSNYWIKKAGFISDDTIFYATDDPDFTIHIHNLKTDTEIIQLKAHKNSIVNISVSPDKTKLLSSANDSTFIVWDLKNFSVEKQVRNQTLHILDSDFLTDNNSVVTVSTDGYMRFFDVSSQKIIKKVKLSYKVLSSLAVARKEKFIFIGGWDKYLNVFELDK